MPDSDLPPILQTFADDLAAAMLVADAAPAGSAHATLLRRIAGMPRRAPKRCAAVTVAAAAVIALIVVPSFGASRTAIAQAAVLTRAAAALDQPNTILYIQEQNYGNGSLCFAFAPVVSAGSASLMCIGGPATSATSAGISANPADDTLNYSSQEWVSPDQARVHTIYSNGDELVFNSDTGQNAHYDAADDTLTTISSAPTPAPSATPPAATTLPLPFGVLGPIGIASQVSDPEYFEELYQEAQAGDSNTRGQMTVTSQLVGQTTLTGEPVYELRFDFKFAQPATGICDSTSCTGPDEETLLYLDSQTFMPVRSVELNVNSGDQPAPSATTVRSVTDYTVQRLPDTPANEALLQMSPHPDATQIQETRPATTVPATGASGATGATGQTGETGATGATDASASAD